MKIYTIKKKYECRQQELALRETLFSSLCANCENQNHKLVKSLAHNYSLNFEKKKKKNCKRLTETNLFLAFDMAGNRCNNTRATNQKLPTLGR